MGLPNGLTVAYGDLVLLTGKDHKIFLRTLIIGGKLQTHLGQVMFDEIVGVTYGEQIKTHTGQTMYVLAPNLDDVFTYLKRETQIIYPKDLGYIVLKMAIREGVRVIEAGTGSGALTSVLAMLVGESGHVYSYDRREKTQERAIDNVKRLGLAHRVTFHLHDIEAGFFETDVHALFLDVPGPADFLPQARQALRGGGFFGAIVPTMNQVIPLLSGLYDGAWYMLELEEILRRTWKAIPPRVRPDDTMVSHTGFLVFARAITHTPDHVRQAYDNADVPEGVWLGDAPQSSADVEDKEGE